MFFRWTILDIALAIHAAAVLLSVIIHYNTSAFLEGMGSVYLFIFYFIFSRLLVCAHIIKNKDVLIKGYWGSVILTIAGAWIGLLLYLFSGNSTFITLYNQYPYFGNILRLKGFSSSSNVLVSNIFTALLLLYILEKKTGHAFLILIVLTIIFTFSKEIFIYICGALIFYNYSRKKIKKNTTFALFACMGIFYLSLVYFTYGAQNNKLIVAETPVKAGNINIYPTTYFYLARSELLISKKYFPWGCGKGNFITALVNEQSDGNYPAAMLVNEPHDAYAGMLAECGVAGLISIFLIFFSIAWQYNFLKRLKIETKLITGLGFLFLLWTVESLALGTVQFRHYWLIFALFNAIYYQIRFKNPVS